MSMKNNLGIYTSLKDEDVIKQSLLEPDAFSIIVERYEVPFRHAARRILGGEDADDAVQETFVRMYMHANKYAKKEGIKFSSWAYAILVRVCYTIYSKNKRHSTFSLDSQITDEIEDFSERNLREYGFDASYLLSMVSKLPALLRRTVELYVFDHKSEKEIAKLEGVSYGVVRTRLSRARDRLREINLTNRQLYGPKS